MRSLSPDEAELWDRVAATIRPLSREKISARPGDRIAVKPVELRPVKPPPPPPPPPTRAVPVSEKTLDGTWDRKLRGGAIEPDRVLDLHGMNLNRAWAAIDRALEDAIDCGDRVVLLITGHHRPGEPPVQRGRIRAAVHDWLAASRHARDIAAVRGAHRRHGGGGSLYLIMRRKAPRR